MRMPSTRMLLTCAAVGVACAVVFIPTVYFGTAIQAVVPWLYGIVAGSYLLPGVIVQSLFRRGGLAVLTTTIGGLATAAFVPGGIAYVPVFALVGALQEIPFAVSGYRCWRRWVFDVAAVVFGVVVGVGTFAAVAGSGTVGLAEVVHSAAFVVGFTVFTEIGLAVAAGVARTGVTRGLRLAEDRRRSRRSDPEAAIVEP